jgi:hypothetical protein
MVSRTVKAGTSWNANQRRWLEQVFVADSRLLLPSIPDDARGAHLARAA